MNDERRLELEQYFDGELPLEARARVARELSADADAARYLEQLRVLRALAVRHDPSAVVPAASPLDALPWRRPAQRRRWAVRATAGLAAAAAVLAMVWYAVGPNRGREHGPVGRPGDLSQNSAGVKAPDRPRDAEPQQGRVAARHGRTPDDTETPDTNAAPGATLGLDAQRYAWANGEIASPAAVARTVLEHAPRRGQRPAEVEILAIELANATSDSPQQLARSAAKGTTTIRQPLGRSRSGNKPTGAPTVGPGNPRGVFHDAEFDRGLLVAESDDVRSAYHVGDVAGHGRPDARRNGATS